VIDATTDDAAGQPLVSIRDALSEAQRRLGAAGVPSPGNDAIELLCHVLQTPRSRLFMSDRLAVVDRVRFERLLMRRCARVPLQHLTGRAPFRRMHLRVGTGVFVPRPETEVVAQAAIDALIALPAERRRCVDLCAGSGAIALAVATEVTGVAVDAVEIDPLAASWTRLNVEEHARQLAAAASSVTVHQADATSCAAPGGVLADAAGRVEVVVANPPYIPLDAVPEDPEVRDYDPGLALYGGPDGLDVVRGVIATAGRLLRPGGLVVIEHADVQADALAELLEHAAPMHPTRTRDADGSGGADVRWTQVASHLDLTRRPRFVTARKV